MTKNNIKNMKLLSEEEIKKLTFHELCLYLDTLNQAEEILEGDEK